jgi:hypothetical protein
VLDQCLHEARTQSAAKELRELDPCSETNIAGLELPMYVHQYFGLPVVHEGEALSRYLRIRILEDWSLPAFLGNRRATMPSQLRSTLR